MRILVTGGAGFIGSALVRHLISDTEHSVLNVDALTYAGNLKSLHQLEKHDRYRFEHVDIRNERGMEHCFKSFLPDRVIHLAAESHVDRSIKSSTAFLETNVLGTQSMLEQSRKWSERNSDFQFIHVSTDEVYGDLDEGELPFDEECNYAPSSPYAASKAASDHLARAWMRTYGLPVIVTHCSNNYGPYHNIEKFIPNCITRGLLGKEIPIYGDGGQTRDWLHVSDHVKALTLLAEKGEAGQTYCIGGGCELRNIDVAEMVCDVLLNQLGERDYRSLLKRVTDRAGHDRRYAIDASKMKKEFGWEPKVEFSDGLRRTVRWFTENRDWWQGKAIY